MTTSSMQQTKPLQAVTCKYPEPNEKQAQSVSHSDRKPWSQHRINIYLCSKATECRITGSEKYEKLAIKKKEKK